MRDHSVIGMTCLSGSARTVRGTHTRTVTRLSTLPVNPHTSAPRHRRCDAEILRQQRRRVKVIFRKWIMVLLPWVGGANYLGERALCTHTHGDTYGPQVLHPHTSASRKRRSDASALRRRQRLVFLLFGVGFSMLAPLVSGDVRPGERTPCAC